MRVCCFLLLFFIGASPTLWACEKLQQKHERKEEAGTRGKVDRSQTIDSDAHHLPFPFPSARRGEKVRRRPFGSNFKPCAHAPQRHKNKCIGLPRIVATSVVQATVERKKGRLLCC
ncbi:hypothetical protein BKA57DRAFT_258916 [Linnemannia elongata]|nr:hypothetical protein BKA57DRAFT_258916 [Linnemannia elongata]